MKKTSSIDNYLVSIICTSYNQLDYLLGTVKSILGQTYLNIELIIVDDASDSTQFDLTYINEFINENNINSIPFVILINEVNLGHAASLNKGISVSNGRFFIYINGDDILPKDSVQALTIEQVKGSYDICFGRLAKFNGEFIVHEEINEAETKFNELLGLSKMSLIERIVIKRYLPFTIPGSLISRNLFDEIGGFEEGSRYIEDLVFFFKIAIKSDNIKFGLTNSINYIWRDYSGLSGSSNNSVTNIEMLTNKIYVMEDYLKTFQFFLYKTSQMNYSELEISCQRKIDIYKFKIDYLKARVNNASIFNLLTVFFDNRKIIIKNISLNRIFRFLHNRVGN